MKHKIAFIGPSNVHSAFSQMESDWDFQIPLETLEEYEKQISLASELEEFKTDLENGLITQEDFNIKKSNVKISADTNVTIFFSRLFKENPSKFSELVAYSAPYSVACILIPSNDIAKDKNTIEQNIKQVQLQLSTDDYNVNTPFFFVTYENPLDDIYQAIKDFTENPLIHNDIRETIKTMLSYDYEEILQDDITEINENYSNTEESLVIPEKPLTAGTVISITSSKGGSGKSSITLALASYIAKASKDAVQKGLTTKELKVCIVDMDTRDGQLGFLNDALSPNIMDILAEGQITEETVKKGIFKSEKTNVDCIFATKRPITAKEISSQFYIDLIEQLRIMYDVVFLDTSVLYIDPLLKDVCYPMSDKIILVTEMVRTSIFGSARWISENIYAQDNPNPIPEEKVGIVINKAMAEIKMPLNTMTMALKGLPILAMIPSAPRLFAYCTNVIEMAQVLNVKGVNDAFSALARSIIKEPLGEVPYTDKK